MAARIVLVSILALVASCAADRSRETKSATLSLTDELHGQSPVADRDADTDDTANLRIAVAVAIDDNAENARAVMLAERAAVGIEARARLLQAEAKVNELMNQSARVPTNRRARWTADLTAFARARRDVQRQLDDLTYATVTDWRETRERLEQGLDDLEGVVWRLVGNM
jgi:hypothetical protein